MQTLKRARWSIVAMACVSLGAGIETTFAAVLAAVPQDTAQQTKYDVTVRNDAANALTGISARVYFDTTELAAAGLDASLVRCDERYDPSGLGSCTVTQFSGSIYYADLRFGALSLAAGASVGFKITLRLSDWSNRWNGANDFSRSGLTGSAAVTTFIPLYQGANRLSGSDPGGGSSDTQAPSAPGNLAADVVSSSRVNLSWNASTDNVGVAGYRLYRAGVLVASPTGTTYGDTGLAPATSYSYLVRAVDTAGNVSAPSITVSALTPPASSGCAGAYDTAAEIQNAMLNAAAGSVILIAPGTYTGDRANSGDPKTAGDGLPAGVFYSERNGTAANRIVLRGCDAANPPVLRGDADDDGSYGIHLTGDYWELRNLVVAAVQKGVMLDNANHNSISNIDVHDVGDEAVHFRDGSSYNTIEYSRIAATGKYQAQYGEGVYVGSDGGTSTYEHTVVDNVIRHVQFGAGITAEHIDVKEGATGTLIEYNDFNGTGISGQNSADSFIDIKGINSIVRYNTGRRNGNANVVDAFQVRTHGSCCATGTNNRFNNNSVHLDGIGAGSTSGYAVFATSQATGTTSANDQRTDGNPNIFNRNVNR